MDINSVTLIGRLTKDVELRYTQSNIACATIDLAVNNGKDKDGNEKPADFIRVVVWEKQAENMAKYTHKGSRIAVDGKIKTENWENEQGEKRYRTYVLASRVQFLDTKREEEPLPEQPDYLTRQYQEEQDPFAQMGQQVEAEMRDEEGYELPF